PSGVSARGCRAPVLLRGRTRGGSYFGESHVTCDRVRRCGGVCMVCEAKRRGQRVGAVARSLVASLSFATGGKFDNKGPPAPPTGSGRKPSHKASGVPSVPLWTTRFTALYLQPLPRLCTFVERALGQQPISREVHSAE